ncbi:MAG: tetratricopeptide repeat protein [Nitrospirae bacterium]|nr:tetratricopeptide repeat protein [Nitrospirota bacterium]
MNRLNCLSRSDALLLYCSIIFCLLLTGCSLPRIVILDDPLTPEEHINLGITYEKKGEMDNAVEEFKKASKKLPAAYLYLGNAYMQKGDLDEAESHYKKAIRKQPDLADAYNNLAWLYYNKAKGSRLKAEDMKEIINEAEDLVLKALELNPSNENYKDTLNKIRELKSSGR